MGSVRRTTTIKKAASAMQRMAFLVFSLLYFPLSVLSVPKPDQDNLVIHLHSNRSTPGEVDLDIHPAQLEGASKSPKSGAGFDYLNADTNANGDGNANANANANARGYFW